ncbi:alpha/beta hydrolase [Rhodococcus sp. MEB064]|uniref:alpha/beta hydrolase n=1 Tax=Rhodococcus sp. MEB064 TaxID=1587522 RepID=UPI0005AD0E8E|nr:alpha/beta hydrolase [Rhodococcus sp. MEB064]
MQLSSVGGRLAVVVMVGVVAAACGAGPSTRPDVAVEGGSTGGAVPSSDSAPADAEPLPLEAPITDLNWSDCTARTTGSYGVVAAAGVVVDCATFAAPIDRNVASDGTFELSAVRVRLSSTPADAVPLVYTSGTDRPSAADIAAIAAQPDSSLLATHPIVGVDRRGIGNSAPFDCYSGLSSTRDALFDLGQFSPGTDPADRVATLARDATIACTDFLLPEALIFATTNSADDLEALREAWGVRALSLLGSGNGALVALAYTAAYGDHVARLVLDSPTSVVTDAVSSAEQTVRGEEAALTAFSTRCAAIGCSLGADPRASVVELFRRADAGELAPLSGATVREAVVHLLSYPSSGDSAALIRTASDTVAGALAGNIAALDDTVNLVRSFTETDGHFVSVCTDGQQWPAPDRVRELQSSWAGQYPAFGATAALDLLTCSAWPATTPPPVPSTIGVPVLVLSGTADAITGTEPLPAVTGALGAAGAATTTVTWDGIGHPVTVGSGCGRSAVGSYLASGDLPGGGNACPA